MKGSVEGDNGDSNNNVMYTTNTMSQINDNSTTTLYSFSNTTHCIHSQTPHNSIRFTSNIQVFTYLLQSLSVGGFTSQSILSSLACLFLLLCFHGCLWWNCLPSTMKFYLKSIQSAYESLQKMWLSLLM